MLGITGDIGVSRQILPEYFPDIGIDKDLVGFAAFLLFDLETLIDGLAIIQPPIMRLLTTKKERRIRMEYAPRPVSRLAPLQEPSPGTVLATRTVLKPGDPNMDNIYYQTISYTPPPPRT
jgi:hypothetical protein